MKTAQAVVEKHVDRADPAFPAVIGSLGAIGILTRVQFRLIDELYFDTVQKIVKLKEILADLTLTSRKYDFWRIDWLPDTDEGLLWAATRIPAADADGDYPPHQSENVLKALFKALGTIESAGPLLDEAMRVVYTGLALTYGVTKASGPLRNMLPVDRRTPLHVAMAEWSFNPADLNSLMERCKEYFRQKGWPNLPIEIELTKTDNYYMSAWNWPGLDYIVKFNFMYLTDVSETGDRRAEILAHLHGLWDHLMQSGIPFKAHWGKINFMDLPVRAGPLRIRSVQALHSPGVPQQVPDRATESNPLSRFQQGDLRCETFEVSETSKVRVRVSSWIGL